MTFDSIPLTAQQEFLGDWINLLGHQRAAHQILMDLFNPQTVMQDETRRKIIGWYIRFDLFAGMMSGGETKLGREWFAASRDFYTRNSRERPDDTVAQLERYFAESRLLATDIALLFAAKGKQTVGDAEFSTEVSRLLAQSAAFGEELEGAFPDASGFVQTFPNTPSTSEEDIADYRDPKFLLDGDLFTMNFVKLDYWSIDLMLKYNLFMAAPEQQSQQELMEIALKKCKMIEMIQHFENGPPGVILGCQASLGIASLFLPKEPKYTNWCRRKYALVEQKGCVNPRSCGNEPG